MDVKTVTSTFPLEKLLITIIIHFVINNNNFIYTLKCYTDNKTILMAYKKACGFVSATFADHAASVRGHTSLLS